MSPSRHDSGYDRRTVLKLTGAAGAASLAGCVGTGNQTTTEGGGDGGDGGGGTATDMQMASSAEGWAWDVAAKSLQLTDEPYEKQAGGSGVDVSIKQMGHSALVDKFKSTLVSGSGAPDFAIVESQTAPSHIDTGGLLDLSDRIEADGLKSEFVSGKWEALRGPDGGIYALPWDLGPVGVFYRSDVYEEHGIDPGNITTWEQYIAAGDQLPDGVSMGNLPPNDLKGVWRMQYRQLGGKEFTKDGKINIGSQKSVRVARNIKKMAESGNFASVKSWSSSWFTAYEKGKIASLPAGAWMEGTLKDSLGKTSGNWGVYKLPAYEEGGNHATNWGGSNLCIPKQTSDAKTERAWDYMKFALGSADMQNKMYKQYGIFPAYKPAYEDQSVYDAEVEFFGGQKIRQVFVELAGNVPGYIYTVDTPTVSTAMNKFLANMVDGKLSPEEACQKAAEQVANKTGRELA